MKKILILLCLVLGTGILLSGCSITKEKNEEEIKEDLLNYIVSESNGEIYDVNDFVITDRDTNKSNKTDTIWFTARYEAANYSITCESVMEYSLSDQAWNLKGVWNLDNPVRTAKVTVTQEEADQVMEGYHFDTITFVDRVTDTEAGIDKFYYQTVRQDPYRLLSYDAVLVYQLTSSGEWRLKDEDGLELTLTKEEYDFLGEWHYSDENTNYYIKVDSFDKENEVVNVEYILEQKSAHTGNMIVSFHSNGVTELKLHQDGSWFYTDTLQDEATDAYTNRGSCEIHFYSAKEVSLDPGGKGTGIAFEGYWLKRVKP